MPEKGIRPSILLSERVCPPNIPPVVVKKVPVRIRPPLPPHSLPRPLCPTGRPLELISLLRFPSSIEVPRVPFYLWWVEDLGPGLCLGLRATVCWHLLLLCFVPTLSMVRQSRRTILLPPCTHTAYAQAPSRVLRDVTKGDLAQWGGGQWRGYVCSTKGRPRSASLGFLL